ncbi:hypothetical protein SAMD00019534_035750 [Acytostelium subglobosum LB1]|uniref:hypothetical protein n=1 Tax=Acytostelium subglobosum LB1 TaxID=1410327 RepID=UPI000644ABFB|nr:hypothetical protein SAMD00019534_035750 [Acytostelium subglobosum LB1]GAM20400.1 hypothetical protein SAMD00019534_035750 [Acytostelium subglobosum LB1]|eukprot:XP_012759921.1 hypothetical protein SAMD00019534_035750 [Acytostelium subglobosum LB1]
MDDNEPLMEDDDYSDEETRAKRVVDHKHLKYKYEAEFDYKTTQYATFVMNALEVDKEINLNTYRKYSVEDSKFRILYASNNPDDLRRSLNSFYDMLLMATRTLNSFPC